MPSSGGKTCADRKSTRLNSSHGSISYAVFCLQKKNNIPIAPPAGEADTAPTHALNPRLAIPARWSRGSLGYSAMNFAMHCSDFFFFFNDTATTEIYTLSLHDALPI